MILRAYSGAFSYSEAKNLKARELGLWYRKALRAELLEEKKTVTQYRIAQTTSQHYMNWIRGLNMRLQVFQRSSKKEVKETWADMKAQGSSLGKKDN